MRVVVDASVAVKWLFPEPAREPGVDKAAELLRAVKDSRVELVQPPHWLAELVAVTTRLRPSIATEAIDLLVAMEITVAADAAVYKRASRIAAQLNHHVFDTLYHAVALEQDAVLVTADDRYLRKAEALGSIVSLRMWQAPAQASIE